MRTSGMSGRGVWPSNPGAIKSIMKGVASTPSATRTDVNKARIAKTAPATRPASSCLFARKKTGVHRNERRGEHAFAKKILQEIRDAEGGAESVGYRGRGRSSG